MELISGKELFDTFGGLSRTMDELAKFSRRARLPKWKQRVIRVCESIVKRLEFGADSPGEGK